LPPDSYSLRRIKGEWRMSGGRLAVFSLILAVLVPAATAQAQSSAAADPSPAPGNPVGFAQEFGQRLSAGANASAADREDRAALAAFYAGRQQEPVWVTVSGL